MAKRMTVPELFPPPGYAHVATADDGGIAYTAGAVPLDAEGNLVGAGDYAAQTLQVIQNLDAALAAVGAAPEDVLRTTVYVTAESREDLLGVWEIVRESSLAGAASTLLGVSLLACPGQLVEIEAVARVDAGFRG
jgi:enamine deaminase RidA (YjgF/YER057c/UK114 family)